MSFFLQRRIQILSCSKVNVSQSRSWYNNENLIYTATQETFVFSLSKCHMYVSDNTFYQQIYQNALATKLQCFFLYWWLSLRKCVWKNWFHKAQLCKFYGWESCETTFLTLLNCYFYSKTSGSTKTSTKLAKMTFLVRKALS